ncbi:MAG: zinc ribbon domain-containing protein [Candidatus Methanomethylophilaceae archaeon]|nr:zinc ribbon domain-containing protein [Candidatus Methanomethylophilaceae archaeon]
MSYCRNCGLDNMPGNRFCQRCGAELDVYNQAPGNAYYPQNGAQGGQYYPGPNQVQPNYQNQAPAQYVYRQEPPVQQQPQGYQQPYQPAQPSPIQSYQSANFVEKPQETPAPQTEKPKEDTEAFTVHISKHESALLSAYAQFNKTTVEDFMKKAAMEKLRMEFARKSADNAYNVFANDQTTYTLEEVMNGYDL